MATTNDDEQDLPNLQAEADIGDKSTPRAKDNFRGREKNPDADYDELPSVNRRSGMSKLVTWLGFILIMAMALGAIITVNSPKDGSKEKKGGNQKVANNLPPLLMPNTPLQAAPQPPPPIPLQYNKPPPQANNGKPVMDWTERKMKGNLVVGGHGHSGKAPSQAKDGAAKLQGEYDKDDDKINPQDDLAQQLVPTAIKGVSAAQLPNRNYLITKGTSIDCVLETAIDTGLAGLTTCKTTRDVYSDNNHVLLLNRGSKLVGEMKGGIRRGQVRIGVLWTRAKTPDGVIIDLNSLGTDSLGRSGLEGWVDNHFLERFGAAILVSLVETTAAVAANRLIPSDGSGTTNNFGGGVGGSGGGVQVVEGILQSQVNIPPTIIKNQGESLQVMVARDLDFSDVYKLKVTP